MKLRFNHFEMANRFTNLIKRHGYTPSVYNEEGWIVVESAIDGTPRRKLMSEWRHISMETNDTVKKELNEETPELF